MRETPTARSFEWPRFSSFLAADTPPASRVLAFLAELARPRRRPGAVEILEELLGGPLTIERETAAGLHFDHVGFVAPPGLDLSSVETLLRVSAYRVSPRLAESTVLARELSARFGRTVPVMLARGHAAEAEKSFCPAVEVFVPVLPSADVRSLVGAETGCHVALAGDVARLSPVLLRLLRGRCTAGAPTTLEGPAVNEALGVAVLYVDVPGGEHTRRLEITSRV